MAGTVRLGPQTVRRLAISKQHLSGKVRGRGPDAIMSAMEDMRYLQLDPTNIVAPSHLLVLWSRLGPFRQGDLDRLMWRDKKLIEYWAHAASIVLTKDYPFYLARMKSFFEGEKVWDRRLRAWMKENPALKERIIAQIRAKGPLSSRDFVEGPNPSWKRSRTGWGLKPSAWSSESDVSRMLQFLFHDGTLAVVGRQGRQKVWDLSERWLPKWTPRSDLTEEEVEYEGAQLSLKALGAGTRKQIAWHFLQRRYPNIRGTIERLIETQTILPIDLEGSRPASSAWYIHADDLPLADRVSKGEWEPRTTLLSPFDNLITDRDRAHELFDYFFRIEIYTPKPKRKHGFFVMSVLDGDEIVGRIDPVMDREKERLVINAVHAEGRAKGTSQAKRVANAIEDLGEFLGARRVVYSGRVPDVWKAHLK